MKALSIHPIFAALILYGEKTIECRSWKTDYRGDILICSTTKKVKETIPGHALCVVRLADVVPFKRDHLKAACMTNSDFSNDFYAWKLNDLRLIKPFEIKGKLSLWNCDKEIEVFDGIRPKEEWDEIFKTYYEPLFV